MAVLVAFLDVLRWLAAVLSLVFGFRKLYRWLKRKLRKNKQNPPRKVGA